MSDYEWVTDEMFDRKLRALAEKDGVPSVLAIPGVYELVREELNNDVLAALEEEREDAGEGGEG